MHDYDNMQNYKSNQSDDNVISFVKFLDITLRILMQVINIPISTLVTVFPETIVRSHIRHLLFLLIFPHLSGCNIPPFLFPSFSKLYIQKCTYSLMPYLQLEEEGCNFPLYALFSPSVLEYNCSFVYFLRYFSDFI